MYKRKDLAQLSPEVFGIVLINDISVLPLGNAAYSAVIYAESLDFFNQILCSLLGKSIWTASLKDEKSGSLVALAPERCSGANRVLQNS